jgi:hypothetical protein
VATNAAGDDERDAHEPLTMLVDGEFDAGPLMRLASCRARRGAAEVASVKAYRSVWTTLLAAGLLVGFCTTALTWSPAAVLAVFVVAGMLGGCVAGLHRDKHAASTLRRAQWVRLWLRDGTVAGTLTLSVAGLIVLLHFWALPLVMLGVVTSPAALRRLRRPAQSPPVPGTPGGSAAVTSSADRPRESPGSARTMSTGQLCEAWRDSYVALQTASSVGERALVVARRQSYIDEFERRDPAGLHTWLSTSACAQGNPARCFSPGRRRQG